MYIKLLTIKIEESLSYHGARRLSSWDLTVEREQSLTLAGFTMTPGGERAIVVDSDYENKIEPVY